MIETKKEDCLYITKKQSTYLTIMLLGIFVFIAVIAYVAGYRAALAGYIQDAHKISLADEIYTNIHGLSVNVEDQQE